MRLYVWLNSMNTGAGQERKFLAPRSSAAVDNNMPAAQATCESRPGGCVEGAAGASDFLDVAMAGDPASVSTPGEKQAEVLMRAPTSGNSAFIAMP